MRHILLFLILFPGMFLSLSAQHIGYLIPAGGQPGTTVEILIGGQQFWGIKGVRVSGKGVTVESVIPVPSIPTISGKQYKFITAWMRNVANGKTEIPAKPNNEEELKTWRKHSYFEQIDQLSPLQFHLLTTHLFVPRNPLQMSPAINSKIIVKLKIAPDAEPGRRELRLVRGSQTLSNPLPFYIDPLPVVREPFLPVPPQKRPRYEFSIPSVICGQILPGETDIWHFRAKKGEQVLFQTFARAMIPFMGDCVPGYFQCVLELRDPAGRQIAFADDNGFEPDPVLCCTIPEDGEYALHVRDALYRGRADFVYRIRASFGEPPVMELTPPPLDLPRKKSADLKNNRKIEFPVLLEGCIETPGQTDPFVIRAEKGEKIVGEVFARRLGSSLDSRLTVTGPDGSQIAFNDDTPRFLYGPILQHTDSHLCFTAPQTGNYTFQIADTAGHGGRNYGYFLRIDHVRPSFHLYIHPSAQPVRIYNATPVRIRIEPQEGFNRDIRLRLQAPNHYSIIGSAVIPAGTKETIITLTCPDKQRQPVRAELIAEAELEEDSGRSGEKQTIRGTVFYGDEETQAFAYSHLVPSEEWLLSKVWGPQGSQLISLANPRQSRLNLLAGGTAQLRLKRRKLPEQSALTFQLRNAPDGLALAQTEVIEKKKGQAEIILTFRADSQIKPQRINLPVTVIYQYQTKPNAAGKTFRQKSEYTLPSLLFDIRKE